MHKYIFLFPLLLVFTFSCNAHATRSVSLVMPLSVSGVGTASQTGYADSEIDIDYTGVGFRYEEKTDSVGIGVEFTSSANYAEKDDEFEKEASGTEVGVFARKYWSIGRHIDVYHARPGQALIFVEAGTMLGLGYQPNDNTGVDYETSGAYTNLKLAVGSRIDFNESMFAELSAGLIQTISPATTEVGEDVFIDTSTSAFGFNVGLGMNF